MTVHSLSEFVETLFASWRLPPWATDPASVRASFCMRAKSTAALMCSKPPRFSQAREKGCCTTAFFLCRRPAGFVVSLFCHYFKAQFSQKSRRETGFDKIPPLKSHKFVTFQNFRMIACRIQTEQRQSFPSYTVIISEILLRIKTMCRG